MIIKSFAAAVSVVAVLVANTASGAIVAVTFPSSPERANLSNDGVFGWQFTVNAPITMTMLGWFDGGTSITNTGDGLIHAHDVGLWDSSQNLLASATVPAGTSAVLDHDFRFVAIAPIELNVGTTYIIAGTNFGGAGKFEDSIVLQSELRTMAGEVNYIGPRSSFPASSLTFPVNGSADTQFSLYFGPNFEFESAAAVPEPASVTLWAIGALGCAIGAHRRKRAAWQ